MKRPSRNSYRAHWAKCTLAYGHEPRDEQWTKWLADQGIDPANAPSFLNEWPRN